jgi:hypothetical protein
MILELIDAFPYQESQKPDTQKRIKEASYRVYDEYRAAAKAPTKKKRNQNRKRRRHVRKKQATV